jgi:hypothetical protein
MGTGVSILIALGSLVEMVGIVGIALWMAARSGNRTRADMRTSATVLKRINDSGTHLGSK